MNVKEYSLKIKSTASHPLRDDVQKMLDSLPQGEYVPIKTAANPEMEDGAFQLYSDSVHPDNGYGCIKELRDPEGNLVEDEEIAHLLQTGNYEIRLTGKEGRLIKGVMLVDEAGDVPSGNTSTYNFPDDIKEIIQKNVQSGVYTQEQLDRRLAEFALLRADLKTVCRIIRADKKHKKKVDDNVTRFVDPFAEESWKRGEESFVMCVIRDLLRPRSGVALEGPKSLGKGVLARYVAWLLWLPVYGIVGNYNLTIADFCGEKTTDNTAMQALFTDEALQMAMEAAKAKMQVQSLEVDLEKVARFMLLQAQSASVNIIQEAGEYIEWLKNGGIFLYDEFNLSSANNNSSLLNPVLDNSSFIYTKGFGEIEIHPDCKIIVTQNVDYSGCEEQNEANMSRMSCERMRQPDTMAPILMESVKAQMKIDGFDSTEIRTDLITQADKFYQACIKAVEKELISNSVMNIRGFTRAIANVIEADNRVTKLKQQVIRHVINGCPHSEESTLRSMVEQFITL